MADVVYLSADELLTAVAGGLIDHELKVDGKVIGLVQIRSLELLEVQSAVTKYKSDGGGLTLWVLDNALVTPPLTDVQRESVHKGRPGPLLDLAKHIMTISGMAEGENGGPLAGGTSPS